MIEINAKRMIGLIFFLVNCISGILAQGNQQATLAASHEKIYIHFDRPYYSAGETIWFKAYLYNNGHPSLLSNEFYLQLEDSAGKIIDQKKYPVSGAIIAGDISLSDSLIQGYYTLKAITKTIASDDADFLYTKSIFIFNTRSISASNVIIKKKLFLQFFPESGHLIDRIKTQVAFKATDETGNPVEISGVVKSDSITVLTPFNSFHDGIGKISFTPHLADILVAEVEWDGDKYRFSLPAVEPSGIYLKISDADSGKIFEITRSKKDMDLFDTVRVVVKMNNDTVFQTLITFNNEQTLRSFLKTTNIPSGILHFIVLNKSNVPMAERLSFADNKEYLLPKELVFIKRDSNQRAGNSFELKFSDSIQKSFSIAVTDISTRDYPDKENIYSRFLLTSDLKGYVYNPGYYFEKDDTEHRQALDNLMLSHGWTRYNWKHNAAAIPANNNDSHHYLILLSGIITERNTGKPVVNGTLDIQLITGDSIFQSLNVDVDNNGRFKIDSLLFFGNAKIFYSYFLRNGKKILVKLSLDREEDSFSTLFSTKSQTMVGERNLNHSGWQPALMPAQYFDDKYKQLSPVFLKAKAKRAQDKINEIYTSAMFRNSGKLILDNINEPYYNKTENVFNYALTNIQTLSYDQEMGALVNKKNFSLRNQKNWKVALLLNESQSTVENVKTIHMDRVALIKFYEAGFVGANAETPGGALAIYLKKSENDELPVNNTLNYLSYEGYSFTQDFYSPDYTIPVAGNNVPDNRLTLYWDPMIMGTFSKDMKFSFFNNDISRKICITIEGFDAQGRLLHYENIF